MTSLHRAAEWDQAEVARLLLGAGGSVDSREPLFQRTPLHVAAAEGHVAVARVLVDAGADVEARDSDGRTALQVAAASGGSGVVALLSPAAAGLPHEEPAAHGCGDLLLDGPAKAAPQLLA
ncbi:uncharacterized protein LOC126092141 [Schistocerca cancellata]|uniref:uncharacterized protein LOC126092141 n=1 Tax=Schistocerca cancellata TaxID=274614 RepID=UPI0021197CE1|nr:uncharacterized protein LOC126092141 [Schistocerca cancellata]